MTAGVTTPNLTPTAVADSLVVNRGGNTYLQTLAALGAQLAASGPVAAALLEQAARIDQIEVDGDVFASTGAGLAGTVVGAQFRVRSSDPDVAYRIYRHDAGPVATLILAAPSVAALAVKADHSALAAEVAARESLASEVRLLPVKTDPSADDAETLSDQVGAILRRTDAAGEQYLPGLAGRSVQQAIRAADERSGVGAGQAPHDVFQVEDASGNVTLRQDRRGAVYIPGLAGSLQGAIGQPLSPERRFPTARDALHDLIHPLTAHLRTEGLPFIDPPALLVPNRYDVPDGIINAFSCSVGAGIWLDSPNGLGGMVHPYLLEMRRPLLGYRYLLGETPHRNAIPWEENPIIYGSNDLRRFDLLPDFPQPLGHPPGNNTGYNSDIAFTYDPRGGALICFWRELGGSPATVTYHYRSTWDGVNWTAIRSVPMGGSGWLSPSILYDPAADLWRLWVVPSDGAVAHYTGPSAYGPWTLVGSDNFQSRFGVLVWHIEVKWLGDRFAILANNRQNLYLGLSGDGTVWDLGTALISPDPEYAYKGSFVPQFSETGASLRLRVCWDVYAYPLPPGMVPVFHSEATNWVNLNSL